MIAHDSPPNATKAGSSVRLRKRDSLLPNFCLQIPATRESSLVSTCLSLTSLSESRRPSQFGKTIAVAGSVGWFAVWSRSSPSIGVEVDSVPRLLRCQHPKLLAHPLSCRSKQANNLFRGFRDVRISKGKSSTCNHIGHALTMGLLLCLHFIILINSSTEESKPINEALPPVNFLEIVFGIYNMSEPGHPRKSHQTRVSILFVRKEC